MRQLRGSVVSYAGQSSVTRVSCQLRGSVVRYTPTSVPNRVQAHHAVDLYAAVLRVERAIYREKDAPHGGATSLVASLAAVTSLRHACLKPKLTVSPSV